MLEKLRDESPNLKKSPDADALMVELARGLIRDQARNARVLFLTGDRSLPACWLAPQVKEVGWLESDAKPERPLRACWLAPLVKEVE